MARRNVLVGLEIGTTKVSFVVGESRPDGTLKILGIGQAPSRGVRKGEIIDFETAHKCVHEALVEAETRCSMEVETVYIGVSGGHIESFNNRGMVDLPEDREEIDEEDLHEVQINAREVTIPTQNAFLHTIIQHYYVDGQEGIPNPVGMLGNRLEADFHIIHGIKTRIQNSIRCVKEIPLDVEDVVLNGLATAQVVLDTHQKNLGALVIDMGGGTTDYVVYHEGAVKATGVFAVGGDHITNDISMGLRIPINQAEKVKIEEGSVVLGNALPGETIHLQSELGFAGKEISRETLNTIMHMRVQETFELIKRRIDPRLLEFLGAGVFITGGCSRIHGLDHLAEEVFGLPVQATRPRAMSGVTSAIENPELATAIGIVRFAQAMQLDRQQRSMMPGVVKRLFSWLSGAGN